MFWNKTQCPIQKGCFCSQDFWKTWTTFWMNMGQFKFSSAFFGSHNCCKLSLLIFTDLKSVIYGPRVIFSKSQKFTEKVNFKKYLKDACCSPESCFAAMQSRQLSHNEILTVQVPYQKWIFATHDIFSKVGIGRTTKSHNKETRPRWR